MGAVSESALIAVGGAKPRAGHAECLAFSGKQLVWGWRPTQHTFALTSKKSTRAGQM